jgi:hypothetical protein
MTYPLAVVALASFTLLAGCVTDDARPPQSQPSPRADLAETVCQVLPGDAVRALVGVASLPELRADPFDHSERDFLCVLGDHRDVAELILGIGPASVFGAAGPPRARVIDPRPVPSSLGDGRYGGRSAEFTYECRGEEYHAALSVRRLGPNRHEDVLRIVEAAVSAVDDEFNCS